MQDLRLPITIYDYILFNPEENKNIKLKLNNICNIYVTLSQILYIHIDNNNVLFEIINNKNKIKLSSFNDSIEYYSIVNIDESPYMQNIFNIIHNNVESIYKYADIFKKNLKKLFKYIEENNLLYSREKCNKNIYFEKNKKFHIQYKNDNKHRTINSFNNFKSPYAYLKEINKLSVRDIVIHMLAIMIQRYDNNFTINNIKETFYCKFNKLNKKHNFGVFSFGEPIIISQTISPNNITFESKLIFNLDQNNKNFYILNSTNPNDKYFEHDMNKIKINDYIKEIINDNQNMNIEFIYMNYKFFCGKLNNFAKLATQDLYIHNIIF